MSEIQQVPRQTGKPVLSLGDTGYEMENTNSEGHKLTTHLEFVDSNLAFGTMTSEKGRDFNQRYCVWIAENENTPTEAEVFIRRDSNFKNFSNLYFLGSIAITVVGAIFSLWSWFFFPLMLLAYIGFIAPRKPTAAIGLDVERKISLIQRDYSVFDDESFKKVLALPNAHDFTTHVRRMVNLIGVEKINRKYFLDWLNVASKIMLADTDSAPDLIPFGLEDAQEVLAAIVDHNKRVKIKEAEERAQEAADNAVVANTNADMTEKQLAEHSLHTKKIALERVRSLNQQIFGDE